MPVARAPVISHCANRIISVPTGNQTLILWPLSHILITVLTQVPSFLYFTCITFDVKVIGRFGGDINFTLNRTQSNHV
jgi:hypothetical protein